VPAPAVSSALSGAVTGALLMIGAALMGWLGSTLGRGPESGNRNPAIVSADEVRRVAFAQPPNSDANRAVGRTNKGPQAAARIAPASVSVRRFLLPHPLIDDAGDVRDVGLGGRLVLGELPALDDLESMVDDHGDVVLRGDPPGGHLRRDLHRPFLGILAGGDR